MWFPAFSILYYMGVGETSFNSHFTLLAGARPMMENSFAVWWPHMTCSCADSEHPLQSYADYLNYRYLFLRSWRRKYATLFQIAPNESCNCTGNWNVTMIVFYRQLKATFCVWKWTAGYYTGILTNWLKAESLAIVDFLAKCSHWEHCIL